MIVKENGKYVYHHERGEKRICDMTDAEKVEFVNSHQMKDAGISPKKMLEMVENGEYQIHLQNQTFEEWKSDVLAGKYDQ